MTDPTGADWSLQLRQPMFDAGVITAILAAATIFGVLPGIAEFVHALRAARRGSAFKQ
jgi:Ca2+/H+ antiporter